MIPLLSYLIYEKCASRFHIQRAKEGNVPLPFSGNRAEKRSRNLGEVLGEVLALR